MTIFLETSALLRAVFHEKGGEEVTSDLRGAERIIASRLLRLETERALLRVAIDEPAAEKQLPALRRDLENLWARVTFLEITRDICEAAGRIAPISRLRTLDAIHLASFHRVREVVPDARMLTCDQRLLALV